MVSMVSKELATRLAKDYQIDPVLLITAIALTLQHRSREDMPSYLIDSRAWVIWEYLRGSDDRTIRKVAGQITGGMEIYNVLLRKNPGPVTVDYYVTEAEICTNVFSNLLHNLSSSEQIQMRSLADVPAIYDLVTDDRTLRLVIRSMYDSTGDYTGGQSYATPSVLQMGYSCT